MFVCYLDHQQLRTLTCSDTNTFFAIQCRRLKNKFETVFEQNRY